MFYRFFGLFANSQTGKIEVIMEMLLLTVTKWQLSRSLVSAHVFDNVTCSGGTDPSLVSRKQPRGLM